MSKAVHAQFLTSIHRFIHRICEFSMTRVLFARAHLLLRIDLFGDLIGELARRRSTPTGATYSSVHALTTKQVQRTVGKMKQTAK
jgi:hypothetical protein